MVCTTNVASLALFCSLAMHRHPLLGTAPVCKNGTIADSPRCAEQFAVTEDQTSDHAPLEDTVVASTTCPATPTASDQNWSILRQCAATAGWAPFHYFRGIDGIGEPWRFHLISKRLASDLASYVEESRKLKPGAKLGALLRGCSALVLVNWLPQKLSENPEIDDNKLVQINEEHLAATAAAVQNLLLLIQSLGWEGYWSSGGILGSESVFSKLQIACQEKLLAAVFVHFNEASVPQHVTSDTMFSNDAAKTAALKANDARANNKSAGREQTNSAVAKIFGGKHRERRSAAANWFREIDGFTGRED